MTGLNVGALEGLFVGSTGLPVGGLEGLAVGFAVGNFVGLSITDWTS